MAHVLRVDISKLEVCVLIYTTQSHFPNFFSFLTTRAKTKRIIILRFTIFAIYFFKNFFLFVFDPFYGWACLPSYILVDRFFIAIDKAKFVTKRVENENKKV